MPSLTLPIASKPFPYAILGLSFFVRQRLRITVKFDSGIFEPVFLIEGNIPKTSEKDIIDALGRELPHVSTYERMFFVLLTELQRCEDFLAFHAFFCLDDVALRGSIKAMGIIKNGKFVHFHRWFSFLESLESTVAALAALSGARSRSFKKDTEAASFGLFLSNAVQGHVVTRFPPEPSGYLHIGHVKAAILNQYFAKQYDGKLIIRFDDTNPTKEKEEYEHAILADLEELGIQGDVVSYSSDYFPQLYDYALKMIKNGRAYVDDTERIKMNGERMHGIASDCRDNTVEESISKFEEMRTGTELGVRCCLRAKISVDNPNKAMRDPVIYRCIDLMHPRTGTTWKIYPTYDFACPIIDSLEGVTHALRSNEYRDRNAQYAWMLDALDLRHVYVWDFSRLNFVYTFLSKRLLRDCLDRGLATGWDDPRFPTFRGIRRRGMTVEALRQFMMSQGPSQNQLLLEWDSIWALNKKIIDPIAPRYWSILEADLVRVTVRGMSTPVIKSVAKHKKNSGLGTRQIFYTNTVIIEQVDAELLKVGDEIVLMNWSVAVILNLKRSGSGIVTSAEVELRPEGDFKLSRKVTWLADPDRLVDLEEAQSPAVPITLLDFDYLITKQKFKKGENVADWANPCTEFRESAWADASVSELRKGDIIQFERKGLYIVDSNFDPAGKKRMDFIHIPDGKATDVALKLGATSLTRSTQTPST
ncbi:glutamate-tRNA ligase [Phellopilus nigrolimitatus]|nr:glutamate-tRNA ligase [Phellopilus nigrolimitatus]